MSNKQGQVKKTRLNLKNRFQHEFFQNVYGNLMHFRIGFADCFSLKITRFNIERWKRVGVFTDNEHENNWIKLHCEIHSVDGKKNALYKAAKFASCIDFFLENMDTLEPQRHLLNKITHSFYGGRCFINKVDGYYIFFVQDCERSMTFSFDEKNETPFVNFLQEISNTCKIFIEEYCTELKRCGLKWVDSLHKEAVWNIEVPF